MVCSGLGSVWKLGESCSEKKLNLFEPWRNVVDLRSADGCRALVLVSTVLSFPRLLWVPPEASQNGKEGNAMGCLF